MQITDVFNISKDDNEGSIDILGNIGGSFFSEGFTKEMLNEKLKELEGVSKINVNISSLGGSVNDGLTIYDMLREYPARIVTKVYGMTASMGTIVAQAGDERLISDNSMYLVHQPMLMTAGNITEHEQSLEALNTVREVLVNIYNKKTKKSKKELKELMDENNGNGKWITSKQAVEWGFADATFEPKGKSIKNFTKEMMNCYNLPELPTNNIDMIEEIRAMFNTLIETLKPKDKEVIVDKVELTEVETRLTEIDNKIKEAENINNDLKVKIEALEGEKVGFESRITELNAEVERLTTELSKVNAKGTKIKGLEGAEDEEANLPEEIKSLREDIKKIKMALNPPDHKPAPINEKE